MIAAPFPTVVTRLPGGAQVAQLGDGRFHLQHGPIDIIAQAWGDPEAVQHGLTSATARFDKILMELCAELPQLRSADSSPEGPVARVMAEAVRPFRPAFVTPMAAVAGAVAQEILQHIVRPGVTRAYVNNGGDIALHLGPGQSLACAIAAGPSSAGRIKLRDSDSARGIATSGWRGRSWSLGIADSVTALAHTAAMADAAATMIANAVDLPGHPGIARRPAAELQADSDLGHRLVTVGVPQLTDDECDTALSSGLATAESLRLRGLVEGACLFLQGKSKATGMPAMAIGEYENE